MSCINHCEHDDACPMCVLERVRMENTRLKIKVAKFYAWFRMPENKVDEMLEKLP